MNRIHLSVIDNHYLSCVNGCFSPELMDILKDIFKVANDQGLKGNQLYDLDVFYPNHLDEKITIECKYKEIKNESTI